MTIADSIKTIAERGVVLSLGQEPGTVHCQCSVGFKPTPQLLAWIERHKPAILAELRRQAPLMSHDRRKVAVAALAKVELDAPTRAKVLADAERQERAWAFLVRDHGYPPGWFFLTHTDSWLQLHHGKTIATEGPGDTITHWWICDAPLEPGDTATVPVAPKMAGNEASVATNKPKQGSLLP